MLQSMSHPSKFRIFFYDFQLQILPQVGSQPTFLDRSQFFSQFSWTKCRLTSSVLHAKFLKGLFWDQSDLQHALSKCFGSHGPCMASSVNWLLTKCSCLEAAHQMTSGYPSPRQFKPGVTLRSSDFSSEPINWQYATVSLKSDLGGHLLQKILFVQHCLSVVFWFMLSQGEKHTVRWLKVVDDLNVTYATTPSRLAADIRWRLPHVSFLSVY